MSLLIIMIVIITCSVFLFRKKRKSAKNSGKGILNTVFIPLLYSWVCFVVLFIFVAIALPKTKSSLNNSSRTQDNILSLKATGINEVTSTFDPNNKLEMSIYNDAKKLGEDSFERGRTLILFNDYGVSVADFDQYVLPECSKDMKKLEQEYKMETENWIPFTAPVFSNPVVMKTEQDYRNRYNKNYLSRVESANIKQRKCFYELSQKLPSHVQRTEKKV